MFSVHESTYASEFKRNIGDVYICLNVFKLEFKQYFKNMKLLNKKGDFRIMFIKIYNNHVYIVYVVLSIITHIT